MRAAVMDPRRDDPGLSAEAELQTDVMRFFALLAICLIALMSLARETAPPEATAAEAPAPETAPEPAAAPVTTPAPVKPVPRAKPAPVKVAASAPRPEPVPESVPEPVPKPVSNPAPAPAPPAPPSESPPAQQGPLELRFASPHALDRLDAAGEVSVFAVADGAGFRWSRRDGGFAAHALPEALYLMDPATVPPALRTALARASAAAPGATWGVTLSPAIRDRLERRLAGSPRGLLLIDAAGNVVDAGARP